MSACRRERGPAAPAAAWGDAATVVPSVLYERFGDLDTVARQYDSMKAWTDAHPTPTASISDVADHIDHVRRVAGIDHVGLGGDFDGVDSLPVGLGGVDTYPALLAELMKRGWTEADIRKLAGENMLRVMRAVEAVAKAKASEHPNLATVG